MNSLISRYKSISTALDRADWLLPTLARFLFAAILLHYFWASGLTKLGDGISGLWQPSVGAYAQIFPKTMEAVVYDTSQLGVYHWAVVTFGTWAEFILPLLIVVGMACRLAALGMIGFVAVQSLTDLFGHNGIEQGTLGAWFDKAPDGIILDQRALWVFLLLVLVIKGAGPLSLDRAFGGRVAA
ncbi:DoxX family membrane protein [Roseovarius aestuariivivens]|uniref:DoxX family membrane protein n=1 Tax=Roseovarius aestuariivivens TaxID=1888910 RepID=UPI001436729B|nr:DoxX family membrane protein [Roseovarius aestuariivivens]